MSAIVSEEKHDPEDDRIDELPFDLVCLDMDGTLLNDDHQITDRTASLLNTLSSTGVTICIATGRSHISVIEYLTRGNLKLCQEKIPIICFNGSACILLNTRDNTISTLFCDTIPKENVGMLLNLCEDRLTEAEEHTIVLQYYDGATGAVNVAAKYAQSATEKGLLKKYADIVGKQQTMVESYEGLMDAGVLPVKCLCLTPEENCDRLLARSKELFPPGTFHAIRGSPFAFFVEFLKPGCNKGTAVARLVEHLASTQTRQTEEGAATSPAAVGCARKYSLERTIAFGDGENDCEMLACVGHGVAMLNGRPAAKQAAAAVSRYSNHEDGVADYLESVFFV
jgi:hydroxymethylpyrimidine pyrophosphatase-like HAD family hydrolase